jgi:trimethylamine:corrinoid methyltransferase-like protein
VDPARERISLPPQMFEDTVAQSPETFLCAGRSAEHDFTVGNGSSRSPVLRTVGGPIYYFDSKVARALSIRDCADIAHLVDALDHLDTLTALTPRDNPQESYDIDIDTDTLATEVINRVGHSGKFLEDSHNLNHLRREERFTPSLLTEVPYREWKQDPRTIYDRTGDQIAHIMKHHEVPPLEPDLQK